MKKHLLRMLSAILCLSLLPTGMPAWSESEFPAALTFTEEIPALMEIEAGDPSEAEAAIADDIPSIAPDSEEMLVEAILEPALSEGEASAEPTIDPEGAPISQEDQLAAAIVDLTSRLQEKDYASQYEQALWIYRMAIENIAPGEGESAYAAIVEQQADSFGYARAIEALMTASGMECMLVSANGICWNIAKLDGEWTHIDAYADDASGSPGAHFGLTDAAMQLERSWEDASLPSCDGIHSNYYLREEGCKAVSNADDLQALLAEAVQAQESELQFYNAAGIANLSEYIQDILAELAPNMAALVCTEGCLASIRLSAPIEDAAVPSEIILPEAILPEKESISIGLGEQLSVAGWTLTPEGAQDTVSYSSKSKKIATVDENGVVTGKKIGKTTLTLKTSGGLQCSISVSVKKKPSKITITADRKTLGVGESMQLGYKLSSGSASKVYFESLNPEIASVSTDGMVSAIAVGVASIRAVTFNGKQALLEMQILNAPDSIALSEERHILGLKDSFTLSCALPEGSAGSVEWISSDESIAAVSSGGKVTALATGETEIIAKAYNGVSSACRLTVLPAPSKLILSAERKTIGVGEQIQLETGFEPENAAATLKYKSSKSSVASVNQEGVITAKKAGSATITVTAHNKISAKIKITVKKKPSKITITADRKTLGVGESMQLGYKLSSGSAGRVAFDSLDPEIAHVSPDGVVTALATGMATLYAATFNGRDNTFEIEILQAPDRILLSQHSYHLGEGMTATLSAEVNEGSAGQIRFASEDESIAKIDPITGKITAVGAGETRVYAQTYVQGLIEYAEIHVSPAPESISLPYSTLYLGKGDVLQLEPIIDEGCVAAFSYSTSASKYASVNADGLLSAKAVGEATITIKTHNGLSCKLRVKVRKAPTWVKMNPESLALGLGESAQLSAEINSGYATRFTFENLSPDVLDLDENQLLTGKSLGEGVVQVTTHNGLSALCHVQVLPAPESISISSPELMGVGMEDSLCIERSPANSASRISYSVLSGEAVSVSADGRVTAIAPGSAIVRASTYLENVYAEHEIVVLPAPDSVKLSASEYTVNIDETLQLNPIIPEGTLTQFSYTAAKNSFFTIDESGLITPIRRGRTTVTVQTHNGCSFTATIIVQDPYYPEDIYLKEDPPNYLAVNESYTPDVVTLPETAMAAIQWTSSNPDVVAVDASTGKATGISYGRATITGVSQRNPSLSISYSIVVLSDEVCLKLPNTRTYTGAISTTLKQIKAVRTSAYSELEKLYLADVISKSDYTSRYAYITRAFDMHLMPWMTKTKELYWKAANSEDGLKDFKTTMVYYGLPYTQANRRYNKSKAVSAGYFTENGSYYLLQGSKFSSRQYPGNDCSSFVSMAIWGTDHSNSYDTTRDILSSSSYRTLTDWTELRPGDLLDKNGHVVMFLYYTNKAKDQIMIIEQGGSTSKERGVDNAAYSNTIACSIKDVSYYTSRGYIIRRVKSLGY